MDSLNVSAIAVAILSAAVAGFVEFVNRLWQKDYEAATKIAGAAAIGGVAGGLGAYGLDIGTGIVLGLSASGFIAAGQKISSGTTA